ncbi:hypothetical protein HPP92_019533 [Vanilla planifolia]|uniref:Gamma-tubulin complex component n=1 Tax=Vanilla planifolia TaxID=51239 RepID=A0A835UHN0_VANPL|nr:hypothetical protein HPP92_019533 [Vanilla planifolia]
MLYLTDATQICFLSDDAKEIAAVVKNILQCALEFRTCFGGIDYNIHSNETDQPHWHSQINFAKVSIVKATFEKNLRELYLMYLKSSKHREFSLSRFWSLLNYNEYYSSNFNKQLGYSYL